MATYDSQKRSERVKLQLRDKNGLWIVMGKKAKWFSKNLGKQMSGTIVGIDGQNAYIMPPLENPTHRPMPFKISLKALGMYSPKADLKDHGRPEGTAEAEEAYKQELGEKFDAGFDEEQKKNSQRHQEATKKGQAGKLDADALEVDELGRETPSGRNSKERDFGKVSAIKEDVAEVLESINDSDFEESDNNLDSVTILDEEGNSLTIEARKDSTGKRTIVLKDSDGNTLDSWDATKQGKNFNQEVAEKIYDAYDDGDFEEELDLDGDGIPDSEDPKITLDRTGFTTSQINPTPEDLDALPVGDVIEQDGYTYIKGDDNAWTGYESADDGNLVALKDENDEIEFYISETLADGSEFTRSTKEPAASRKKRAPKAPKAPTEGVDNDNDGVADDREIDHDSDGDGIPDKDDPSGESVVQSEQERTTPTEEEAVAPEEAPTPIPEDTEQETLPGLEKPKRNQDKMDELNKVVADFEQKIRNMFQSDEPFAQDHLDKIHAARDKAEDGRYASDITRAKNAVKAAEKAFAKQEKSGAKTEPTPAEDESTGLGEPTVPETSEEIPAPTESEAPVVSDEEPFGELEEVDLPEAEVIEEEAQPEAQSEPVQEAPEPAPKPVVEEPAPAPATPVETPVAEPTAPTQEAGTYIGKPTSVSDPVGTKYGLDSGEQFTKVSDTSVSNDADSKDVMTPQEFDAEFDEVDAELPGNGPVAEQAVPNVGTSSRELREYVNHWDQTDDNGDKYIPNLSDRLDTIRDTKESVDIDLSEYHQNDSVNSLGIAYTDGRLIEIGDRIMYRSGKTHADKNHPEYADAYHEVEVIGFDSQGKVNMLPIDSVDYYTHDSENNALYVSKPLEGVLARGSKKGFMHATPSKLSDFDGKRIYKSSDIPTNRPDAIRILTEREAEFRGADGELLEVGEPVRFRHRDHDRTIMVKDPISGEEIPTRGPSYNKIFEGTIVSLNPAVQSAVINISKDPETEQLITASLVYSVSGDSTFDPPTPSSYATGEGLPELPEGFTRHLRRVFHDEDLGIADSGEADDDSEQEQEQEEDFNFDDYDVEDPEVETESEEDAEPVEADSLPTSDDPAYTTAERSSVEESFGDLEEFDAPRPVRKGVTKSVFKGTDPWKSEYGRFFRDVDKQEFTSDRAKSRHIATESPVGSSVALSNGGRATKTSKDTWDFKSRRGGLVERDMSNSNFAKKLLENNADILNNGSFRAPNKTNYTAYNKESIDTAQKNIDNAIRRAGDGATISTLEGILTKDGDDWYNPEGDVSEIPEDYSLVGISPDNTITDIARVGKDQLGSVSVSVSQGLYRKTDAGWESRDLENMPTIISDSDLQEIMLNNESDSLVDAVFVPSNATESVRGNMVDQLPNASLQSIRDNVFKTPRGTVVKSIHGTTGGQVTSTLVDPGTKLWRNELISPVDAGYSTTVIGSLHKAHDQGKSLEITQPSVKLDHDTIDEFYSATAKDTEPYNDQDLNALMNLGHTPVDFQTMSMEEIVGAFKAKFGDDMAIGIYNDRGEIDYDDQNIYGAKKVLEGYFQIRSKYPWMQSLGGFHIDKSDRDSDAMAYVSNVDMGRSGEKVDLVVQSSAANGSSNAFLPDNGSFGTHFMPASDSGRYVGHHESGHIMDGHRYRADDVSDLEGIADWVAEFLGISEVQLLEMSYGQLMKALSSRGYTSGYGFQDIYADLPKNSQPFKGVGILRMDHYEMIAESFADVEQNGSKASEVSKFIWKKLVSSAQLRAMYFRDHGNTPTLADLEEYKQKIS